MVPTLVSTPGRLGHLYVPKMDKTGCSESQNFQVHPVIVDLLEDNLIELCRR
jgi:hypothetical protein